jgi:Bacterial Ig-like domain (group 2)
MVEVQRLVISFESPLQIMEVEEARPSQLITVKFENFTITAEGDTIMYTLPVDHTVKMQVAYVDAAGNPATIDGDVIWASSDTLLATVAADLADSTIVTVTPLALGQVQITATADADIGTGVRELITTSDITIVGGEAVSGTIQPVGELEPKP